MMPRVSVVLPFRNAANWLSLSLASLLLQRDVEIELVAIDDGSSDGSAQLLRRIWSHSPWPVQLIITPGLGVSQARNLGWKRATGDLVAFLDADDLCLDGRLAHQAALLGQNPALQHVLCGWRRIDHRGKAIGTVEPWREGAGFTIEQALRHKAVLPSAWMLRRGALERSGGFDPGLSQAEDVDLLCRLAFQQEPGEWLQQVACGYRIHPQGASQAARAQARSLLFVMHRQLARLPADGASASLAAEVTYATRAWAGWHAWASGDKPLAEELWNSSLGMSPMPPALSWVHLAENVARSSQRVGQPFQVETLLSDPIWLRLEQRWCREHLAGRPGHGPRPDGDPAGWRPMLLGSVAQGLAHWRQKLLEELGPNPSTSPWWPATLRDRIKVSHPLGELRHEMLSWTTDLLAWDPAQAPPGDLRSRLAQILWQWALACWSEDRRPTLARLEQSAAIWPSKPVLGALARLHRWEASAGAAALNQLASRLPSLADKPPEPPPGQAFWEQPGQPADSCMGPQCPACIEADLRPWTRLPLAHGLVRWIPPSPPAQEANDQAKPLAIWELPGGSCWIRPPLENPWGITHAVAVADQNGAILPQLSRRYPQPWRSCPTPSTSAEPPPSGKAPWLDATVLAVADLSAEIYYHWLLEALPRIGLALESLRNDPDAQSLLLWHNGGDSHFVAEGLQQLLGLAPERLIDARRQPHIQARRLLVPAFPSPFSNPTATVQSWLRRLWLDPDLEPTTERPGIGAVKSKRLWLRRGDQARRSVWGEATALEQLQDLEILGLDPGCLSVQQQARLIASAQLVVAPHGASLANLVFANKGTTVLELHQPGYSPPYFHPIAASQGLIFHSCEQPQRPPVLYQDLLWEGPGSEPICLDPGLVRRALELVLPLNTDH